MISLFIVSSSLIFNLILPTKDTIEPIEVKSSVELLALDTALIYAEIQINENEGLIKDIILLENLHFIKLVFISKNRKTFPFYSKKVKELRKAEFICRKIEQLPNFIPENQIQELLVEGRKFQVNEQLLQYNNLKFLGLFCNSKVSDKLIICQLKNLEELAFQTSQLMSLDNSDCLYNLKKLHALSLNLNVNTIHHLVNFNFLKEINFENKITLKVILKNKELLKKYDKITIPILKISNSELDKIKKVLPNI